MVNPLVQPFDGELRDGARMLLEGGMTIWKGEPPDTADPTASFPTYDGTPLAAFVSLDEGVEEVSSGLDRITCPVLCISSRKDHIVPPVNGDLLVSSVGGPLERVWIERSYHNAMVDFDHEEVERRIEAFVVSVTSEPGEEET